MPASDTESGWAAVVVNYEAGERAARVRPIAARRHERRRAAGGRRRRQRLDRRLGRPRSRGAFPSRDRAAPGREPRLRRAPPTSASPPPTRRSSPCCNPDLEVEPEAPPVPCCAASTTEPDLGAVGPLIRNPDGTVYPSARSDAARRDAVGHGLLGLVLADEPFTRRYRQLDADPSAPATSTGCRARRSGCGATRSTRSAAGTSATSCTSRTSTCAGGSAAGLAGRVRAGGRSCPRAGREHGAAPVPDDRRAPPVAATGSRRSAGAGRAASLLPFAAVFLALRAALAMADHAPGGADQDRQGAPGNLGASWPKSDATATPGRRPGLVTVSPSAAGGSFGWNVGIALVVVVGIALLVWTVVSRREDAQAAPAPATRHRRGRRPLARPARREHLRRVARPPRRSSRPAPTARRSAPASTPTATASSTSTPSLVEAGDNATVGQFLDYGGWSASSRLVRSVDRFRWPSAQQATNGDECTTPDGATAKGTLTLVR